MPFNTPLKHHIPLKNNASGIRLFFFALLLTITSNVCAQMQITYPLERMVFQRNLNNEATLSIEGSYKGDPETIEIRIFDRISNKWTNWKSFIDNPENGFFKQTLTLRGGWYSIELRGVRNKLPIDYTLLNRVGVGEVFVVAGQSNATGSSEIPSGPGATDDRVNTVDFQNLNTANQEIKGFEHVTPPYLEFVHLDQNTRIAPFGGYSWCWGAFGDKLVNELNVPVLIFNAGWPASSARNWRESLDIRGYSTNAYGYRYPAGLPFGHLRIALNFYTAHTGVRAVLWHQGESDNLEGRSREAYREDLKQIIEASRTLSKRPDLPWLVARASRFNVNGSLRNWKAVIDAQNDIIGINSTQWKLPNVFEGPSTDEYTVERLDGIHFSGEKGGNFLAQLWIDALLPQLPAIQPTSASTPFPIQIRKEASNWKIETISEADVYQWHEINAPYRVVSTNKSLQTQTQGTYFLEILDNLDRAYSQPITIQETTTDVKFIDIRGSKYPDNRIRLHFYVENQNNVSRYELQKSNDMITFSTLASLPMASGESVTRGTIWQTDSLQTNNYYRIVARKTNNTVAYSRTIRLQEGENYQDTPNYSTYFVYPNPATHETYLNTDSWDDIVSIQLVDLRGIEIPIQIDDSLQLISWNIPLQPGIYIIRITRTNGASEGIRLFVK